MISVALIQLTDEISNEFFEQMIKYYKSIGVDCDWYYLNSKKYNVKQEIQYLEEFYTLVIAVRDFNDAYRLAKRFIKRGNGNENI